MAMAFLEDVQDHSLPFSELSPPSLQVFHFHNQNKDRFDGEVTVQNINQLVEYMSCTSTKSRSSTLEYHIEPVKKQDIAVKTPTAWCIGSIQETGHPRRLEN